LLLLLNACAGSPPAPEDHYYRLIISDLPEHQAAPAIPGVLKIDPIKSYGIYRERALLYSLETEPRGLQQHRYHYWIDTPTRLIRDQLVDFLRASGVAGGVAGSQVALSGDLRLKLTLKQLERVIHADRQVSVRVGLDAVITTASGRPVKIVGYTQETAAADASIPASVSALDQTLNKIYFEILGDLQRL
jgi:ABC-type uncharacterized transport system auxiliary subunit